MSVALLSFGAITQGWRIGQTPLILGYNDPDDYLNDPFYLGAIVGRVANRIGGAQFELGDTRFTLDRNEGKNTLHGGSDGLSRKHWTLDQVSKAEALLSYTSQDGEGGFPGRVRFDIRVHLAFPCLTYSFSAQPDCPTPISLAQHNYYTLGTPFDVSETLLKLHSNTYLELDNQGIPTGKLSTVRDGGLDFTQMQKLTETARRLDHYFVLEADRNPENPIAEVRAPSGYTMSVFSDQPGAQVYSGAHLAAPFRPRGGLCIEPSGYPNAPNIPAFPSVISSPDRPYKQDLTLKISGGMI